MNLLLLKLELFTIAFITAAKPHFNADIPQLAEDVLGKHAVASSILAISSTGYVLSKTKHFELPESAGLGRPGINVK